MVKQGKKTKYSLQNVLQHLDETTKAPTDYLTYVFLL